MKSDREKVRAILIETIVALCNKGLKYNVEMSVEGLIGKFLHIMLYILNYLKIVFIQIVLVTNSILLMLYSLINILVLVVPKICFSIFRRNSEYLFVENLVLHA